jgi:hypothetical protein
VGGSRGLRGGERGWSCCTRQRWVKASIAGVGSRKRTPVLKVAPKLLPGLCPQNQTPAGLKRRLSPRLFWSAARERQSEVTWSGSVVSGNGQG